MSGDNLHKLSSSAMSTTAAGLNVSMLSLNNSASLSLQSPVAQYPQTTQLVKANTQSLLNNRYVKLNVGGRLFSTSIDTLTKQDNMLRAMFSGRMDVATDSDGYILIDRCGKHFELVLNYLRDEDAQGVSLYLNDKSELELHEVLKEAKFYCIQPFVVLVEQKILSNKQNVPQEPYLGSSIVSMITSKNDLIRILTSTDKPCIRLLINRHNNKYSYTNNSDDNLLKNIELFERMAIKFKNRIMFIKDTTSTEEICCWYFHGNGKKLAEVCCTSIVYTTEKKQTKVEFPDSKILEEIFVNAVLFESKDTASSNESIQPMGLHHGILGEDDADEMPRITLSANGGSMANGAIGGSSSSGSGSGVGVNGVASAVVVSAGSLNSASNSSSTSSSSASSAATTGAANNPNSNTGRRSAR